jgi:hypothetical protein
VVSRSFLAASLASFHAELGLNVPGNAEPQLGACSPNSAIPDIADTHPFIRQVGDKSESLAASLASFHAELGLSVPGNAEPQLGACSQNSGLDSSQYSQMTIIFAIIVIIDLLLQVL